MSHHHHRLPVRQHHALVIEPVKKKIINRLFMYIEFKFEKKTRKNPKEQVRVECNVPLYRLLSLFLSF